MTDSSGLSIKSTKSGRCLARALEMIALGFSVIPLKPRGKKPLLSSWMEFQKRIPTQDEISEWFTRWPDANIGLVTGSISGVAVIDIDSEEGSMWADKNLPKTSVYQETGKGRHLFYRTNGTKIHNKVGIFPGVDVRGEGGYVVMSPSIHPSGKEYKLIFSEGFDGWIDLADFPKIQQQQVQGKRPVQFEPTERGQRNDTIARMAGKYISRGFARDEVLMLCRGYNSTLREPLPAIEIETIVESIWNKDQGSRQPQKKLNVITAREFLEHDFPPRTNILSPWLPSQGIAMIHAYRGVGKTHFSIGVACAVATGGKFLKWEAPAPAGVLFIDGEMPGAVLQERIVAALAAIEDLADLSLKIITPDLQENGMPDISTIQGQQQLEPHITAEIRLIVLDNISTLCRSSEENKGDAWLPVQEWALRMRARGISVLLIHHDGKGGQQRGTSRKEDVLDTVIQLKHPADYSPDHGALFEVHFRKARGIYGEDVKPFEASLQTNEQGLPTWMIKSIEDSTYMKVVAMLKDGMTQTETATELGISKSAVHKHKSKAVNNGDFVESKRKS
ncbi:MAG: bifunctional DNA primase/polymerase [Desulfobulbaceae bacterium]|nr:bifunctional DNA primase/polymerase [Desulfobulbaceae bacterium]